MFYRVIKTGIISLSFMAAVSEPCLGMNKKTINPPEDIFGKERKGYLTQINDLWQEKKQLKTTLQRFEEENRLWRRTTTLNEEEIESLKKQLVDDQETFNKKLNESLCDQEAQHERTLEESLNHQKMTFEQKIEVLHEQKNQEFQALIKKHGEKVESLNGSHLSLLESQRSNFSQERSLYDEKVKNLQDLLEKETKKYEEGVVKNRDLVEEIGKNNAASEKEIETLQKALETKERDYMKALHSNRDLDLTIYRMVEAYKKTTESNKKDFENELKHLESTKDEALKQQKKESDAQLKQLTETYLTQTGAFEARIQASLQKIDELQKNIHQIYLEKNERLKRKKETIVEYSSDEEDDKRSRDTSIKKKIALDISIEEKIALLIKENQILRQQRKNVEK